MEEADHENSYKCRCYELAILSRIISDIILYNKIGFIKSVNFRERGGEIRRMIQKYNYA